ncbi:MAG: iron-sulfur cluster repair di-iron protein [Thermoanaerobaculia bacterium]|nr:iron-sulfur cluster repair di-iron protein [Thermoanaerobaculia bacterium]
MSITGESIVADIARLKPATVKVFQRQRIDFCCSGNRPLAEACAKANRDLGEVLSELAALDPSADEVDWNERPLVQLIDHIISRYHDRLRLDLPTLGELAKRVATRHGDANPALREVETVFQTLADELLTHMRKEEIVLFPMIEKLETAATHGSMGVAAPPIDGPIAAMEDDHREVGDLLAQLWKLTGGFEPPADACNSYRGLFSGLAELETDTHQHIHLENNILFPGGQRLVEQLESAPSASL